MKNGLEIDSYGTKHWYQNGQRHRTVGPAIEYTNGDKLWYQNGRLHSTDGPAIECANGTKWWYIDGINYAEKEFREYQLIIKLAKI